MQKLPMIVGMKKEQRNTIEIPKHPTEEKTTLSHWITMVQMFSLCILFRSYLDNGMQNMNKRTISSYVQ